MRDRLRRVARWFRRCWAAYLATWAAVAGDDEAFQDFMRVAGGDR